MIVCFECAPRTKILLDSLMESEQYRDYSEVISLAVGNLNVLQNELSSKGVLTLESESELISLQTRLRTDHVQDQNYELLDSKNQDSKRTEPQSEAISKESSASIPGLFLLDGIDELASLASPPADVWTVKQEVPLERWIFGQYNKFLPAKVSCRALAHLLQENPDGVRLEEAASEISQGALNIGSLLAHLDKQNGNKREDALSIAFPSPDRDIEKSRMRYANQFVASVTKKGKVSGLLMDLKLINPTGGNKPLLKLTEAGWSFAKLRNPILDNNPPETIQKFTVDERDFLLDHISSSVPVEDFAYRAILTAIDDGASTPNDLDTALQEHVSQDASQSLTESFLATQRSGAVSRMTDLGLIVRKRDGVRVSYLTTDLGNQYAEDKVVSLRRGKHAE